MGDSGVKVGDKEASYRTWRLCGIKDDTLLKKMHLYIEPQSSQWTRGSAVINKARDQPVRVCLTSLFMLSLAHTLTPVKQTT